MKRLVLLCWVLFAAQGLYALPEAKPLDSIGVTFKNNSYFIVHKVEKRANPVFA